MNKNIFDLYKEVGKVPFKARRTHWSNEDVHVLITKVIPNDHDNYGIAKSGGVFEGDEEIDWYGFENGKVANSGVYSWELYQDD